MIADNSRSAVEVILRNAGNVLKEGMDTRVRVVRSDYRSAISSAEDCFDIVFLDPPYRMTEAYGDAISRLWDTDRLRQNAVIVCERSRDAVIALPDGFEIYDTRHYGETDIDFVRRIGK